MPSPNQKWITMYVNWRPSIQRWPALKGETNAHWMITHFDEKPEALMVIDRTLLWHWRMPWSVRGVLYQYNATRRHACGGVPYLYNATRGHACRRVPNQCNATRGHACRGVPYQYNTARGQECRWIPHQYSATKGGMPVRGVPYECNATMEHVYSGHCCTG